MSPSSSWTVERARIAGMSSRPNRPPDDPDLLAAKRNLKFLRLLEHIEKVLATEVSGIGAATEAAIARRAQQLADAAPDLSTEQVALLLRVLRRYPAHPNADGIHQADGGDAL